ncbi:MAG: hypothetical protein HYS09_05555 [Chloroflexi bacterium]|nr:hypothetical protein [Chloroflexota bacterium]
MKDEPTRAVRITLKVALMLRLSVLLSGLALLGWLFYTGIRENFVVGLSMLLFLVVSGSLAFYMGLRLGRHFQRKGEQALRQYRERVRAKH